MRGATRRACVTLLSALSMPKGVRKSFAETAFLRAVATYDMEDRLIELLRTGGPAGITLSHSSVQVQEAELIIAQLSASGGSQKEAAEGIGSWGSWIGAWDVMYMQRSFLVWPLRPPGSSSARLAGVKLFVYGPMDVAVDLREEDQDASASIEVVYNTTSQVGQEELLLLSCSGSFVKLPAYDFRLGFTRPASAYRLETPPLADVSGGISASRTSAPPNLRPADKAKALLGAEWTPPGAASQCEIAYLSERLWISRNSAGDALVMLRSEDSPLLPPVRRPDLTATCSEAIFMGGRICRSKALF